MFQVELFPEILEFASILDNKYKIIQTIGHGRFAKVKLAIDVETNKTFALKIMNANQINSERKLENFIQEVQFLSQLNHPNIIKILYVSLEGEYKKINGQTLKVIYYVMKLAENGELFQYLDYTPQFSEKIARYYFQQLISGIEYIHLNNIGHLDIKTENLLLNKHFHLKIADFGFSKALKSQQSSSIKYDAAIPVGSPEYNPPEVSNYFSSSTTSTQSFYYADQADIFAIGCVLFLMVMRSAPFKNTSDTDPYYERLSRSDKSAFWKIFASNNDPSLEFKNLIENLLHKIPEKRFSIQQIKSHSWFQGELPTDEEVQNDLQERVQNINYQLQHIKNHKYNSKMEKIQQFKQNQQQMNSDLFNNNQQIRNNDMVDFQENQELVAATAEDEQENRFFCKLKDKYKEIIDSINKKLLNKMNQKNLNNHNLQQSQQKQENICQKQVHKESISCMSECYEQNFKQQEDNNNFLIDSPMLQNNQNKQQCQQNQRENQQNDNNNQQKQQMLEHEINKCESSSNNSDSERCCNSRKQQKNKTRQSKQKRSIHKQNNQNAQFNNYEKEIQSEKDELEQQQQQKYQEKSYKKSNNKQYYQNKEQMQKQKMNENNSSSCKQQKEFLDEEEFNNQMRINNKENQNLENQNEKEEEDENVVVNEQQKKQQKIIKQKGSSSDNNSCQE